MLRNIPSCVGFFRDSENTMHFWEMSIMLKMRMFAFQAESYVGKTTITVWKYVSNPTKEDTDNDGLKDGKATFINGQVAPKDPEPRNTHKMAAVWKKQITQTFRKAGLSSNNYVIEINNVTKVLIKEVIDFALSKRFDMAKFSSEFKDFAKALRHVLDFITEDETAAKIAADIGAFVLNFRLDEHGVAYHAKPETWQKALGYNDLYDDVLSRASDVRIGQLFFNYSCLN